MRWMIAGVVSILLGLFFWMWAIQDGSFSVADQQYEAAWLRRANMFVWIGYGLFAAAVAAFVKAWLTGRQKSPPRE